MLQLNPQQKEVFNRLATGSDGKVLRDFCEQLVKELVDIRNIPDTDAMIEKKARSLAVNIIEENLIVRLKVLNGELDTPDENEYE